ncbi:MAG: hypothetical protein NTV80_12010 [Verrucomicrobia bacterium]|nr:hypothetical protein [Verrucomicrobiota bacterium]
MMHHLLLSLFLSLSFSLSAAQWQISTFAGTGQPGGAGDGGPAAQAQIDNPFGLTRGPDGALYFCEYTGQQRSICRMSSDSMPRATSTSWI